MGVRGVPEMGHEGDLEDLGEAFGELGRHELFPERGGNGGGKEIIKKKKSFGIGEKKKKNGLKPPPEIRERKRGKRQKPTRKWG